jgi:hypothetical protein
VCEEPWDLFAEGHPVRIDATPQAGDGLHIVGRARALLGRKYHPVAWNCDHVVAVALGGKAESSQLSATVLVVLVGIALLGASSG